MTFGGVGDETSNPVVAVHFLWGWGKLMGMQGLFLLCGLGAIMTVEKGFFRRMGNHAVKAVAQGIGFLVITVAVVGLVDILLLLVCVFLDIAYPSLFFGNWPSGGQL